MQNMTLENWNPQTEIDSLRQQLADALEDVALARKKGATMGFDGRQPGDNLALEIVEKLRAELAAERERAELDRKTKFSLHDKWLAAEAGKRELEARVAKLREALEKAHAAFTRPHLVYRESLEGGMAEIRVTERVWKDAHAAINAVLAETGGGDE
jgi:hypothetical protein